MKPPFAYYGGKTTLASTIAGLLPPHGHYVEPFAGSLAVLLAKPRSRMETVNDLDGDLMGFWRVLRDRPGDLARVCALSPHSRAEWEACAELTAPTGHPDPQLEAARRVWVRLTQARTGRLTRTGWRHYVDPGATGTAFPGYPSTATSTGWPSPPNGSTTSASKRARPPRSSPPTAPGPGSCSTSTRPTSAAPAPTTASTGTN